MAHRNQALQTIHSEGGLLPPDLLRRVIDTKTRLEGTQPEDYGLPKGDRLNEAITQSWNRLRRNWSEFQAAAEHLAKSEAGTGLTNEKWTLPLLRELGFGLLPAAAGPEIGGRTYAINRFFGPVPVHLIGFHLSLDHRAAGVRGAAAANPHGLVQEFLNRSPHHRWAIVSNGLLLRVLRDNQALSRQSYLEFNLEAMFAGEVYSDFVLLWLTAHATRFAPREGDRPESCWLEQWSKLAEEQGTRALIDLSAGVQKALRILGEGFTSHPKNTALREALRTGQLPLTDLHRQLLRVVYRLIFLFVAEDRTLDGLPLLHPPENSDVARIARERYAAHYSTARLRELASKIKGSRHGDLWRQFQLLVGALSGDAVFATAREQLALPTLGSFLWDPSSTAALNDAELANHDLLEALRDLAFTRQGKVLRPVDYRNLGAEELSGVYESLLAITPQISADGARFSFAQFAGNERKTSGSYYTPDSLVQCLLDSALDPVVEEAIKGKSGAEAEKAILALRVCDPAVGPGHFLVGAAHRLARHLARVRSLAQGESEPSPALYQHALRDVIGRCLYGVDINPMAAELCRVSLWLEALEPGKPLSFLDHHIRVGNSLLGATPELIAAGLPDEAFTPIEGDDKRACAVLKKRNRAEREGLGPLFAAQDAETLAQLQKAAAALEELPDDRPEEIRAKELAFRRHEETAEYQRKKQIADAWCAAFVIRKYFRQPGREASASGITQGHLNDLAAGRPMPADLASEVERLSSQYHFFHWHLAFPEVFGRGGFDCVLGNPPWERVKLQEKEWFAESSPSIANAPNAAARKRLIYALREGDPALHRQFLDDLQKAEGESHFLSDSGRFPLCGRGDQNLYAVFAEAMRSLLNPAGRTGCVLPTGIAADDTTKFFFQQVVGDRSLASLFDFENKEGLFPGVHPEQKFCLFTAGRSGRTTVDAAEFVFFAHSIAELRDPERRFMLTAEDIERLNPNTRTCPIFRSRRDAELAKAIYRRIPVLTREARQGRSEENPWKLRLGTMFHMTNDSHRFSGRENLEADGWRLDGNVFHKGSMEWFPLYEGKLTGVFDHRAGTFDGVSIRDVTTGNERETTAEEKSQASLSVIPRWWVKRADLCASEGLASKPFWLTFHDIANPNNERTFIAAVIPRVAIGNTLPFCQFASHETASLQMALGASMNSFVFDYIARMKISSRHFNFFVVNQLPVLARSSYEQACLWSAGTTDRGDWLLPRTLELTCTAWDLEGVAQDCGWFGPPFRWDEDRRFLLRCELDAAFFHLYLPASTAGHWRPARVNEGAVRDETDGELAELTKYFPTPRDAVIHIMDTFPIVKRRDEERHGEYHTKRVILEIYDEMAEAMRTGQPYQTRLDPPPGPPVDAEGKFVDYASIAANPPPHIHLPRGGAGARVGSATGG
jgi:hypothetical protein